MAIFQNKRYLKDIRKDLRNHPTKAERLLWVKLKNSQTGHKFRRQQSIGLYVVDFYCPALKLVIEVDGETHSDSSVLQNDAVKERFLEGNGLIVKRISDADIKEGVEGVALLIKQWCDELTTP
ncbi:MAG: DUF559 domain-containing protein [bacterium]|nr:DUF559 domain-containing protein [bacterium]